MSGISHGGADGISVRSLNRGADKISARDLNRGTDGISARNLNRGADGISVRDLNRGADGISARDLRGCADGISVRSLDSTQNRLLFFLFYGISKGSKPAAQAPVFSMGISQQARIVQPELPVLIHV